MAGEERFPIVVEIKPDTAQGERAVGQSLDRLEQKAETTSRELTSAVSAMPRAVGDAVRDAVIEVDKLRAAEEKAAQAAQRAAQEEKEWAAEIRKANAAIDEQAKATQAAFEKSEAAARSMQDAHKSTTERAIGGWKDLARTVSDIGGAIGTVTTAINLVSTAWDKSAVAARAAGEAWNAVMNSGPAAFDPKDTRVARRRYQLENHPEQLNLPAGSKLNDLPYELQLMMGTEREDDLYEAAVKKWVRERYEADKKRTDAFNKFVADEHARSAANAGPWWEQEWAKPQAPAKPTPPKRSAASGGGRASAAPDDPSWFENAKLAVIAYADELAKAKADQDAMLASASEFADQMTMAWSTVAGAVEDASGLANQRRGPRRDVAGFALGKGGTAYGLDFDKAKKDAIDFAAALEGPVGGAIDGLIDGLTTWKMSWEDWGRSVLATISKVMIQLLALQAIEALAGAGGGGWGSFGKMLWGAFGGGPTGGGGSSERRVTPGDPFGGAGQTSGAVWRSPVMPQQAGGGGWGAPSVSLKIVNVGDQRAAALEALQSSEGERVVVNHYDKNRGKLGR